MVATPAGIGRLGLLGIQVWVMWTTVRGQPWAGQRHFGGGGRA
jgi:hypothetical protein